MRLRVIQRSDRNRRPASHQTGVYWKNQTAASAPLRTFCADCSIVDMRCLIIIASFGYVMTDASVSAQPMRQPSWDEVKETAKACSLVVHRIDVPASPVGSGEWAYYIDRQSTSTQRTCFYKRLGIGEVEKTMREFDFAGARQSGS